MKGFFSVLLSLCILIIPLLSIAENGSISDDQCVSEVFLKYADSLRKVSYKEIKDYLDSKDYRYETKIGSNKLAQFKILCNQGSMYIAFYPLGNNDSDFGNPDKEMLTCLEYERDGQWITISDEFHLNVGLLKTGDKSRDPVNQEVSNLESLVDFYNNTIGGSISMAEGSAVFTDADRDNAVGATIRNRVKEYSKTTIRRIDVNSNISTSDPDDFLILVYLTWGTMNGVDRTRTMLEMYSDDMSATLAMEYENACEIVVFWEVPYLVKSGTCAKYSYDVYNGKAYKREKTGPLYY
ncbi:MAG: hypothetical protein II875_12455 [Clostridia bacterium]|nr:hypothetical protein [Clostridia bacterium]